MAGVLLAILLAAGLGLLYWSRTSGFYSEEQHLTRVRKRAEARFLGEDSEYLKAILRWRESRMTVATFYERLQ